MEWYYILLIILGFDFRNKSKLDDIQGIGEIKKQEFYKSFTIGNTPEDQRELTPEEIEEEERDTKEFLKKINDSVGFTNEDIAAALEEQKRMENERRENCFWF